MTTIKNLIAYDGVAVIELPHWLTIYDELVFYCPILDTIFIYSVGFYKDNESFFKKNGLIYLGDL